MADRFPPAARKEEIHWDILYDAQDDYKPVLSLTFNYSLCMRDGKIKTVLACLSSMYPSCLEVLIINEMVAFRYTTKSSQYQRFPLEVPYLCLRRRGGWYFKKINCDVQTVLHEKWIRWSNFEVLPAPTKKYLNFLWKVSVSGAL